jgi:hypothetical protein
VNKLIVMCLADAGARANHSRAENRRRSFCPDAADTAAEGKGATGRLAQQAVDLLANDEMMGTGRLVADECVCGNA